MSLRYRLRIWRRRWCMRRGHPMADWSPLCVSYKAPDRIDPESGQYIYGREITQRSWRCARHDRQPS